MPRIAASARRRALARSLRGTSLGDDTLDAATTTVEPEAPENTRLLRELVASQRRVEQAQGRWFDGDLLWKRIGVIATVTIPLSAAIWRAIGIGRKRKKLR